LTRAYHAPSPLPADGDRAEYWELARLVRSFIPADDQVFMRGLLLMVEGHHGYAHLTKYELPAETSPHGRNAYRLPSFALEVGKVVWVCPTCDQIFKGHPFGVEQYLARQEWILDNLGLHFKLSNSS